MKKRGSNTLKLKHILSRYVLRNPAEPKTERTFKSIKGIKFGRAGGNISILVIFVLIASSLIGVLTMNFINQILYSSDNILSYYKSYYLANAGLELLITEAKNRGIGFEDSIQSGDAIISDNFKCTNCDFVVNIVGRTTVLSKEFWKGSGCILPIQLSVGDSVLIPLFADEESGSFTEAFDGIDPDDRINLSNTLESWKLDIQQDGINKEVNIGMLIMSGGDLRENGLFSRTGILNEQLIGDFLKQWLTNAATVTPPGDSVNTLDNLYDKPDYKFKNYIIIANTSPNQISFCIDSSTPLPTDNFYIKSNGRYHQQNIGLELISKQPIPSFLLK